MTAPETSPGKTSDVAPVLIAVAISLVALGVATGVGIVSGQWSWLGAAAATGGAVCLASLLVSAYLVACRR